jgi:phage tail-like protein
MARAALFTGFEPIHPEHRLFDHWRQMVPEINRVEDDTQDLLRLSLCVQEVLNLLMISIDRFTDQFDIDLCSDADIDRFLYDLGNPFEWETLELSAIQRRKLVTYLVAIYRSKGTAVGIEQTILFLLNQVVHVVPHTAEGWILGVDRLGSEGDIAEIGTMFVEPFDFTAVTSPWTLKLAVDDGDPQDITFTTADFADSANATAQEVSTAIATQLVGGGSYVAADGSPAMVIGTNSPPYSLSGGEVLGITIQGIEHKVTFAATDFESPGSATTDEVLRVIRAELPSAYAIVHPSGGIALYTALTGSLAELTVAAGTAATALGFASATYVGQDGTRVYIYSKTAGVEAAIACTNADSDLSVQVLGLWAMPGAGTGGTILAPSLQRTLYTFDVEIDSTLDAETERLVRDIANYMKAAHEHLGTVRITPTVEWPDAWILGIGALDDTAILSEEG